MWYNTSTQKEKKLKVKQEQLIKLLKHFRDDLERIQRCNVNPNIDDDEYAIDSGENLSQITEEAITELTTLIQGSVLELGGDYYDIWDVVDNRSDFQKAFDKVVAKHLNEEKGAWDEPKRQPDVAEMMGATYDFQPAVLPKDDKKHNEE